MLAARIHKQRRPGVAAVEMVLAAPFLLTLVVGLWEIGQVLNTMNILDNAAREGGRLAASASYFASSDHLDPSTLQTLTLPLPSNNLDFEVQQKVLTYLTAAGLSTTGATVQIDDVTQGWSYVYKASGTGSGSGYDPAAAASQLDHLRVTVSLPFSSINWSSLGWFFSPSTTLTTTSDWSSMRNVPLTVSTTIPTQPILPGQPLP